MTFHELAFALSTLVLAASFIALGTRCALVHEGVTQAILAAMVFAGMAMAAITMSFGTAAILCHLGAV